MLNLFASNGTVWKKHQERLSRWRNDTNFPRNPAYQSASAVSVVIDLLTKFLLYGTPGSSKKSYPFYFQFFMKKRKQRVYTRCTERFIWMQIIISQPWAVNLDKSCDFEVIPYVMCPQYHIDRYRNFTLLSEKCIKPGPKG